MARIYNCPKCKKRTGVDIVYGMPSPELFEQAEQGLVALGGCVIEDNQPDYRCQECRFEWNKAQHFEASKQKWLDEHVKGRDWVEMMDDEDKKKS